MIMKKQPNKLVHWLDINKGFLFKILLPVVVLSLSVFLSMRSCNKPTGSVVIDNPILDSIIKSQNEKIENLEGSLEKISEELRKKNKNDSVLSVKNTSKIYSLEQSINQIKIENGKKHSFIDSSDINQSYNTLTDNIKARKKN